MLFVNGDRWCPWETYDGQRMLPEAWPVIRLEREWIGISVDTDNDDITWTHRTALGLVSEGVAACLYEPDLEWEIDSSEVGVWRRNGTVDRDARIVVDWLLNSPFQRARGFSIERMLTRFFLEVAGTGRDEGVMGGHRLAVGYDPQPDAGNLDTDVWWMTVKLNSEVIDEVIDLLAAHDATHRDIVVSMREPESPQALARREALARWD